MECGKSLCSEAPTVHIIRVANGLYHEEEHFCNEHAKTQSPLTGRAKSIPRYAKLRLEGTSQFELASIVVFETAASVSRLYLREAQGDRTVEIDIGYYELAALLSVVKQEPYQRPWTYPAIGIIIKELGGQLEDVVVKEYDSIGQFHAFLRIRQYGELREIDLRPSDALILALLHHVPMFIDEDVVNKVGY